MWIGEGQVLEPFGTVAILGVGLIGGSIGLALRARGVAAEVVGIGRAPAALDEAGKRGAVDRATTNLDEGAASADGLVCRVLEMCPVDHDEVLAYTSHLPHALAAALAGSVPVDWLPLAAGAYRDGTRVAGADTGLWTAIFRDNRGPMLKALDSLRDRL